MNRTRLIDILTAYGADPERWPKEERAAARRLLADDPSLGAEAKLASQLDRMLARAPAGEVNAALVARVLADAPRHTLRAPATARVSVSFAKWMVAPFRIGGLPVQRPVAFASVAMAIAIGLGAALPVATTASATPDEVELISAMWGAPAYGQNGDWYVE